MSTAPRVNASSAYVAQAIEALNVSSESGSQAAAIASIGFATLALVEEQRTANIIAYWQAVTAPPGGHSLATDRMQGEIQHLLGLVEYVETVPVNRCVCTEPQHDPGCVFAGPGPF